MAENPQEEYVVAKPDITQTDIINVIKAVKDKYSESGIKFDQKLTVTIFTLCKYFFLDDARCVVLQAPTGSGKSVISFMFSECVSRIMAIAIDRGYSFEQKACYYLTSSKSLQDQISGDLIRFKIKNNVILKGVDNYPCLFEKGKTYKNRCCAGYSGEEINEKFWCATDCPYRLQRYLASEAPTATLNYHYFLNVMRTEFKPFFDKRFMTICDEAHKLDGIIDDTFTTQFSPYLLEDISKIVEMLKTVRYFIEEGEMDFKMANAKEMFFDEKTSPETLLNKYGGMLTNYKNKFQKAHQYYKKLDEKSHSYTHILDALTKIIERIINIETTIDYFKGVRKSRPQDLFIRTSVWGNYRDSKDRNKWIFEIKDLDQTQNIQTNFVSKCNKVLMMSATIGDYYEMIKLFGFSEDESRYIKLPNTFDFSHSPIYITNSGSLTKKNFDANIEGCINDVVTIVKKLHPKDKGIIHTHTFNIKQLLQDRTYMDEELQKRLLFYTDAETKKTAIETLKSNDFPYVICGPSLTEGIDLRDDLGRFNILIKVPYPYLDQYAQVMCKRCEFWYSRKTKNEIIQAIGRTNRNKNDFSDVYLVDSKFKDIIIELDTEIVSRLQQLKLPEYEKPQMTPIHQTPPKPAKVTDGMDAMLDSVIDEEFTDDLPF